MKKHLIILVLLMAAVAKGQTLAFWFESLSGTSTTTNGASVSQWDDVSGQNNHAYGEGVNPLYTSLSNAYNPSINFSNSTAGGFRMADDAEINTNSSTAKTIMFAFKTGSDVTTRQMIFEQGGYTTGINFYIVSGRLYSNLYISNTNYESYTTISPNTSYTFVFIYNGSSSRWDAYLNGDWAFGRTSVPGTWPGDSRDIGIGVVNENTQYHDDGSDISRDQVHGFKGEIFEMIYYNGYAFSSFNRSKITSYLAARYGITIGDDYGFLTGSDYWDESTNATYHNDVTVIVRDDYLSLNHKQSKSCNTDALVTIARGSFAASNASNGNSFGSDQSYLAWGNDNGSYSSFSTTGAPANMAIIDRTWKIEESGAGTVEVVVPDNSSSASATLPAESTSVYLIVDTDSDFSNGATSIPMTLNGTNWEVTTDLSSYNYFTFAEEVFASDLSVTTNGMEQGPVNIVFTVTLPSVNTTGSSFTFDIADDFSGSATSGSDYVAIPLGAKISVPNGSISGNYTVTVIDDGAGETMETVNVTISNPSGPQFSVGQASAQATIADNDGGLGSMGGPGGVASRVWYRSDMGTGSTVNGAQVYGWNDMSGNGYNAWTSGTPYFRNNSSDNINFNATHYLNGSSNFNLNNVGIRSSDYTIIGVGLRTATGDNIVFGDANDNGAGNTIAFGYSSSNQARLSHYGSTLSLNGLDNYNSPALTPFILSISLEQGNQRKLQEFRNGDHHLTSDNSTTPLGAYSGFQIGNTQSPYYGNFTGNISEVMAFNYALSDIEQAKVFSYLAVKYGLMLSPDMDDDGIVNESIGSGVREGDFVAAGGAVIWSYSGQGATYYNQVAGIGRDDYSGLDQRQSKSTEADALITIGHQDIATTNSTNTNAFSADGTFMLWGNNGGVNSFTSAGAPSGQTILGRKWRVQETGTVGKVLLQIPASTSSLSEKLPSAGTLEFMVDSDGDFTSGATSYSMTLNGTNWEIEIDLADGEYFTFAPGGAELSVTTNGDEQGPVNIVFTVILPDVNTTGSAFTFDLTDDMTGTATSGSDYTAIPASAKISIPNGAQTGTYILTVTDDALPEQVETIDVSISNPSGAQFFIGQGNTQATISDNDAGPGGVASNLNVWLRADRGTSSQVHNTTVSNWEDQSPQGNDATSDGNPPLFRNALASNLNFNPSVYFDGSNDRLLLDLDDIKSGRGNGNGKHTLIAVGQRGNSNRAYPIGSTGGSYQQELFFGYENNNTARWGNVATDLDLGVNSFNSPSTSPYMLFGMFDGNGRVFEETRDAQLTRGTDNYNVAIQGSKSNYIGAIPNYNAYYNGNINEVIVYDNTISTLDKQKIYSYLGVKYGLMLSDDNNDNGTVNEVISGSVREGDYIASDGTVIWDYAGQGSAYFNDVAGIGRDDASGLDQRVSSTSSEDRVIAIGYHEFALSNSAHAESFPSDKSYLLWGNNNVAYDSSYSSVGAPMGYKIAGRNWLVQKTGSIDTVDIVIASAAAGSGNMAPPTSALYLIIDSDNDFTSGARMVPMTLNGTYWNAKVDLADGEHFTFGTYEGGASISVTTNGDETGPVNIVFTVTLSQPNSSGSAITYDIDDAGTGTATSGSDYVSIPGAATISVANGSSTGTYTVTVIDDVNPEAIETMVVYISNPSNSSFPVLIDTAEATIADNDVSAPGGVATDLVFWLKADAGTNTTVDGQSVSSWADQTSNGNNGSSSGTSPLYREAVANFNPALEFSGNGSINLANSNDINAASSSRKSYSVVFRTGIDVTTRQLIYEEGGGTHGLNMYIQNGRLHNNLWLSSVDNDASVNVTAETTYILTFVYDGNNSRWDAYLNGANTHSDSSVPTSLSSHTGGIGIGRINSSTQYNGNVDVNSGDGFTGHIMEMIYYNAKVLSSNERSRIESYLAVKYGISLSGDYLSSSSSVIWDASAHSGYTNMVSGIAIDPANGLSQKQSKTEDSQGLVTIGLDSIFPTNSQNTGIWSGAQDALIWGNDGGALNFSTIGAPANMFIFSRKWAIEENGTIGNVRLRVPAFTSSEAIKMPNLENLSLLVDSDGDFTSGANSVPMTLSGDYWITDVDFSDGDYFVFGFEGVRLRVLSHGDENGPTDIVVQLKLAGINTTGSAVTFDISTGVLSTAIAGTDYVAIPAGAKFTVPSGDSVATYTITVIDDGLAEPTDSLEIQISNPSNPSFSIAVNTVIAEIYDNDFAVPAGVGVTPTFWLRADRGTSSSINGNAVNTWEDQSPNGHDVTAGSTPPVYRSVSANFNPGINFSSAATGYYMADASDVNMGAGSYAAKSYIIALKTGSDISTLQTVYEQGGSVNGLNLYIENGELKGNWWAANVDYYDSTPINANSVYVCTFVYNGASNKWELYVNGLLSASVSGVPSTIPQHSGDIGIGHIQDQTQFNGGRDVNSGAPFKGQIMEMIYYNEHVFTANQRARLETYLTVKYGSARKGDLVTSDSTNVLWDYSANLDYQYNLSAIGLDGGGDINQKQSSSEELQSILTIGLDTIVTSNAQNSANFSTGSDFLVWGHNNDYLRGLQSNDSLPVQSGMIDRLARLWKVAETGVVANAKVAFIKDSIDLYLPYSSMGQLYLYIADDEVLSANLVEVPLQVEVVNGINCYTATVDFSGTQFFTIGETGFIIWDGEEWRGGLSALVPHGPSDDPLDEVKTMYIYSGDTAQLVEEVIVSEAIIYPGAILSAEPTSCFTVTTMVNQGNMRLNADATGFAQYKGPATQATFEQFIDDEGWHLIGSPFSNSTWGDMEFEDPYTVLNHPLGGVSLDSCTYCNLWWYDGATDGGKDIGFGSSDAYGTWKSSSDSTQAFTPTKGWNLWLDEQHGFSATPWSVAVSGLLNEGTINQTVNENNAGWNLVANPYPTALDWDTIDNDLAGEGIAAGYHVWDHANTNYAVYANGAGTLGLTRYVAPFQGFYVQTAIAGAQGSGNVYHNFELTNADRAEACTGGLGNFYKSTDQQIVIETKHLASGKKDQAIIRFSNVAQRNIDERQDIRKLFTTYKDAPSVFSSLEGKSLAINSIPYPVAQDSLLLGTRCKVGSMVSIEAIKAPAGYTLYLEDTETGKWHRIDEKPYQFEQGTGGANRFWLHFGPSSFEARPWDASKPFSLYQKGDYIVIKAKKNVEPGDWYLSSMQGKITTKGYIEGYSGEEMQVFVGNLAPGTYLFTLQTLTGELYTEKIVLF